MNNSNKRRAELLGKPFGTETAKLRKAILFQLIKETKWKQVEEIRKKLEKGCTLISLSKEYCVDERNIAAIRDNKTWKIVGVGS